MCLCMRREHNINALCMFIAWLHSIPRPETFSQKVQSKRSGTKTKAALIFHSSCFMLPLLMPLIVNLVLCTALRSVIWAVRWCCVRLTVKDQTLKLHELVLMRYEHWSKYNNKSLCETNEETSSTTTRAASTASAAASSSSTERE